MCPGDIHTQSAHIQWPPTKVQVVLQRTQADRWYCCITLNLTFAFLRPNSRVTAPWTQHLSLSYNSKSEKYIVCALWHITSTHIDVMWHRECTTICILYIYIFRWNSEEAPGKQHSWCFPRSHEIVGCDSAATLHYVYHVYGQQKYTCRQRTPPFVCSTWCISVAIKPFTVKFKFILRRSVLDFIWQS
jgi:hypothetical protein